MKKDVLSILKQNTDDYLSGAKIAQTLGISRAAVWKSVESLRSDGYIIDAVTNAGYQLKNADQVLDSEEIKAKLRTKAVGSEIEFFDQTSSTNEVGKARAKAGYEEGYVVLASQQTSGKGRYGRAFYSPKNGGIYMSVILRPKWDVSKIGMLTIVAAVAVSQAVKQICDVEVGIKWVNDLFLDGKKICGILTEAGFEVETASLDYAVVGIGINTFQDAPPSDLHDVITSLSEHTSVPFSVNELTAEILNQIELCYESESMDTLLKEYRERSIILGNQVVFEYDGKETVGVADSIDDDGALIVDVGERGKLRLLFGEVSVRVQSTDE